MQKWKFLRKPVQPSYRIVSVRGSPSRDRCFRPIVPLDRFRSHASHNFSSPQPRVISFCRFFCLAFSPIHLAQIARNFSGLQPPVILTRNAPWNFCGEILERCRRNAEWLNKGKRKRERERTRLYFHRHWINSMFRWLENQSEDIVLNS